MFFCNFTWSQATRYAIWLREEKINTISVYHAYCTKREGSCYHSECVFLRVYYSTVLITSRTRSQCREPNNDRHKSYSHIHSSHLWNYRHKSTFVYWCRFVSITLTHIYSSHVCAITYYFDPVSRCVPVHKSRTWNNCDGEMASK